MLKAIRTAQPKDCPRLLELLQQICALHSEIRPDLFQNGSSKYTVKSLEKLLDDSTRLTFVAVDEQDSVMGYIFCILIDHTLDSARCSNKELYIDDLCVDASVRGKGVAKALFDRAKAYGEELGCDALTLNVWEGNDRARHFYEKCGLTPRKTYMELSL